MELNLVAKTPEQALVKQYLEQNASEELASKINKGLPVEKDGRALISKKDLDGFMKFATEEARKQAAKGAQSACLQDNVVFGWAVHYFEEDSIPGTLYNPDGSLYEPPKSVQKKDTPKPAPIQKPRARNDLDQVSMLDLTHNGVRTIILPTTIRAFSTDPFDNLVNISYLGSARDFYQLQGADNLQRYTVTHEGECYWTSWEYSAGLDCTVGGKQIRSCRVCRKAESRTVEAGVHTTKVEKGKEPTCTETGLSEGKICLTALPEIAGTASCTRKC